MCLSLIVKIVLFMIISTVDLPLVCLLVCFVVHCQSSSLVTHQHQSVQGLIEILKSAARNYSALTQIEQIGAGEFLKQFESKDFGIILSRWIGFGSFQNVYKAFHKGLQVEVAAKISDLGGDSFVSHLRMMNIVANCDDASVVRVLGYMLLPSDHNNPVTGVLNVEQLGLFDMEQEYKRMGELPELNFTREMSLQERRKVCEAVVEAQKHAIKKMLKIIKHFHDLKVDNRDFKFPSKFLVILVITRLL
jgi:hypothetical protein